MEGHLDFEEALRQARRILQTISASFD
jgi:hypothetical protein